MFDRYMSKIKKIRRKISQMISAVKKYPKYSKEFGLAPANKMIRKNCSLISADNYIESMSMYVQREIKGVTQAFNNGEIKEYAKIVSFVKKPIWVCWFQGRDNLPEICRVCVEQIERIAPEDSCVVFLTKDNFKQYLIMPDYIIEKFENGTISSPNFSDLLRYGLLSTYGGMWIDAAILVTGDVLNKALNSDIYSVRFYEGNEKLLDASRGLWIGGFWAGTDRMITFKYCYEALQHLWSKHNIAIEYLACDYILWSGYSQVDQMTKEIDSISVNNKNIRALNDKLNEPFSTELFMQIVETNDVHLINRHLTYNTETERGEETIYGHLINKGMM